MSGHCRFTSREKIQAMGKTKDVREAVVAELRFDPRIDMANITVRNINGEVALNGTVPSYPQYLEAARRAAGHRGGPRAQPAGGGAAAGQLPR